MQGQPSVEDEELDEGLIVSSTPVTVRDSAVAQRAPVDVVSLEETQLQILAALQGVTAQLDRQRAYQAELRADHRVQAEVILNLQEKAEKYVAENKAKDLSSKDLSSLPHYKAADAALNPPPPETPGGQTTVGGGRAVRCSRQLGKCRKWYERRVRWGRNDGFAAVVAGPWRGGCGRRGGFFAAE
eukprot:SAG31_NODE_4902_length_2875_cov_4.001440_4_plen_185_part_00